MAWGWWGDAAHNREYLEMSRRTQELLAEADRPLQGERVKPLLDETKALLEKMSAKNSGRMMIGNYCLNYSDNDTYLLQLAKAYVEKLGDVETALALAQITQLDERRSLWEWLIPQALHRGYPVLPLLKNLEDVSEVWISLPLLELIVKTYQTGKTRDDQIDRAIAELIQINQTRLAQQNWPRGRRKYRRRLERLQMMIGLSKESQIIKEALPFLWLSNLAWAGAAGALWTGAQIIIKHAMPAPAWGDWGLGLAGVVFVPEVLGQYGVAWINWLLERLILHPARGRQDLKFAWSERPRFPRLTRQGIVVQTFTKTPALRLIESAAGLTAFLPLLVSAIALPGRAFQPQYLNFLIPFVGANLLSFLPLQRWGLSRHATDGDQILRVTGSKPLLACS